MTSTATLERSHIVMELKRNGFPGIEANERLRCLEDHNKLFLDEDCPLVLYPLHNKKIDFDFDRECLQNACLVADEISLLQVLQGEGRRPEAIRNWRLNLKMLSIKKGILNRKKWIDFAFLYTDVALELMRRKVNQEVPKLQTWLFIQNQKVQGVDLEQFCSNNDGGAK